MQKLELSDLEIFDERYKELSVEERLVLQMLALIYVPVSRTSLIDCVKLVSFKQIEGKFRSPQVKDYILSLIEKKFIFSFDTGLSFSHYFQSFLIDKYVKSNPSLDEMLDAVDHKYPTYWESYMFSRDEYYDRQFRDVRNALFLGKEMESYRLRFEEHDLLSMQIRVLSDYFSPAAFKEIEKNGQVDILITVIHFIAKDMKSMDLVIDYLIKLLDDKSKKPDRPLYYLLLIYLIRGDLDKHDKIFKDYNLPVMPFIYFKATSLFMRGENREAGRVFEKAISLEKNYSPKRAFCPVGFFGQCYILNLIALGEEVEISFILKVVNKALKNNKSNNTSDKFLRAICYHLSGDKLRAQRAAGTALASACRQETINSFSVVVILLALSHIKTDIPFNIYVMEDVISNIADSAAKNGYIFHLFQAAKLLPIIKSLQKIDFSTKAILKSFKTVSQKEVLPFIDISKIIKVEEPWAIALKSLQEISRGGAISAGGSSDSQFRLAWLFGYYEYESLNVTEVKIKALEQKKLKSGKWSKGRVIHLRRLFNKELRYLTEIDMMISETIKTHHYYYEEYEFELEKALPLLARHPALFLDDDNRTPVELIEEPPQFVVHEGKNGYTLSLSLDIGRESYAVRRETPTRYAFTVFNKKVQKIAELLAEDKKLVIPKDGEDELRSTLETITSVMPIHSNAKRLHSSSDAVGNVKHFDAVDKIHIHLLPVSDGVRVELFVRPFGSEGPFFKPGAGAVVIMTDLGGTPAETARNLQNECDNAVKVLDQCPSLAIRGNYDDVFNFESTDECLEFLMELDDIFEKVVVDWPEGGKLSIKGMRDMKDMEFGISSNIEWFELEGHLKLDESKLIAVNDLIARAAESRFIELGKGEFVAITEKLRDSLASLAVFGTEVKDKLRVHSLNVHQLDSLLDETTNFKPGKKWRDRVRKIKELDNFKPEIPSTLCAELRAYQKDGVKWLAKLAEWDVGACLADDMGLGKTVQAIALLLLRASSGPSLAVAPSSVCSNWEAECRKFAPTLNPILYRESDRDSIMENLKPFDLLIVSYGLLASEQAAFKEVHWRTVILDEAQYIKNHKAKRTKAAFALKGDMRLITTGTPVENHLSELWTLFNFINPGFLGTKAQFDAKFAIPIEKNGNAQRSRDLRRIIQPFILRRIKSEVLEELPPKTEINLTVELSDDERAFYENLRLESIRNLEDAKQAKGGAAHLMVLKELTRLRLASCAPSLVSENIKMKSSKLEMLGKVIEELRDNNHKALIFSQFVKHLSIIRKFCDDNSIPYKYLDGSTSPKERKKRVDAFQNGEGDLFLISLKAGGTGLNLTAADYVIHMDPWWNPAVEDQASDRTHRIGQQRPVTVYRMVAQGTVEEKIIKLHKTKRELADALLEGTDASAKMSLKDLMSIISDNDF